MGNARHLFPWRRAELRFAENRIAAPGSRWIQNLSLIQAALVLAWYSCASRIQVVGWTTSPSLNCRDAQFGRVRCSKSRHTRTIARDGPQVRH